MLQMAIRTAFYAKARRAQRYQPTPCERPAGQIENVFRPRRETDAKDNKVVTLPDVTGLLLGDSLLSPEGTLFRGENIAGTDSVAPQRGPLRGDIAGTDSAAPVGTLRPINVFPRRAPSACRRSRL